MDGKNFLGSLLTLKQKTKDKLGFFMGCMIWQTSHGSKYSPKIRNNTCIILKFRDTCCTVIMEF